MLRRFAAPQAGATEGLLFVERSCRRSAMPHIAGRSMSTMSNHYYRGGLNPDVGQRCGLVGIFRIPGFIYCNAKCR
jgi:hypothetical protein